MKRALRILLTVCFIFITLSGCGQKTGDSDELAGHEALLTLPAKTDIEKLADLNGSAAVQAYLTARTYLDDFLDYNIENGNYEEYRALLEKTIVAFEEVDILSESLKQVSDAWIEEKGNDEKPVVTGMSSAVSYMTPSPFTVYAAGEDNPAVAWAKQGTERFDKAPAGKGIRTLAEHLGTDCKRAFAQLKQAQDILAGAAYEDIANTANKAYQTAAVLKTAGTTAGLVIAVAAAPATTAVGAAISTDGTVISGVNTVLEIVSTGAVLVTNGEDNWVSEACDRTESQMAPIGAIFSVAGVATNVAGFMKTTDAMIKDGVKAGQSTKETLKTIGKSAEVTDDAFGMITFTAGSLTELVNDQSVLDGTLKMDENGKVQFALIDTLLGRDADKQKDENMPEVKEVLKKAGLNQNVIEESMNADPAALPVGDMIPSKIRENVRKAAPVLDPGSPEFDPGAAESFAGSIQNTVEKMQAGEENITEEEEQTSSNEVSEEKWVEPYEYFGVDNSIDLLPKLKENGVTRLEVAPIVFDEKTGEVRTLSNAEPFILSMVDGEVSTFSSSFDRYWEGEFLETEAFTLTFTGGKAAYNAYYWSIEGTNDTTYASGFTDHEEFDDGILYKDNFRIIPEQFHKYIIMDARIGDFLGLEVKRVLLK